jgi:Domain of unknown function (DUF1127)
MEVHTPSSLLRVHGIEADQRRTRGRRLRSLLVAVPTQVAAAILGEFWARCVIRQLEAMDDRALNDIGLRRDQIETAVRHGRKTLWSVLVAGLLAGTTALTPTPFETIEENKSIHGIILAKCTGASSRPSPVRWQLSSPAVAA